MNSTVYLITRKFKNSIKETLKKPGRLIFIIAFAALFIFSVVGNRYVTDSDIKERTSLYVIVTLFYALAFFMTAKSGFVNGASMFSMADVNLIFTSPKKESRVLSYGILSQLSKSVLMGAFILYQYSWLNQSYGVSVGEIIVLALGYAVTVFLAQMLAMLIYSFTCSSDKRNTALKIVFYAVVAAFALYCVYCVGTALKSGGDSGMDALETINRKVLYFFPIAGFVSLAVNGVLSSQVSAIIIGVLCCVVFTALYYIAVSLFNPDYYEDVLKATEVSFSAITASKEGKAAENAPRNVRVGKTGISKGDGASVIFQKHKIENRRSKVLYVDFLSLLFAGAAIVAAYFSKDIITPLTVTAYSMIFTRTMGRWARELSMPYVYLIPESAVKKLFYTVKEQFMSLLIVGIITFVPVHFILGTSIISTVLLVIATLGFGLLLISANLFTARITGSSSNKTFEIMIYFIISAFSLVPGMLAYFALSEAFSLEIGLAVMNAVNFVLAFALMFFSRNILNCAELNNK